MVAVLLGSGKKVNREVAELLNMPCLDRYLFLEELFEENGIKNTGWMRRLSLQSHRFFPKSTVVMCAACVALAPAKYAWPVGNSNSMVV